MKKLFLPLSLLMLFALLLSACGGGNAVATEGPSASSPEADEVEATEEPAPTATQVLTGPMATANALNTQVTLNAPTPIGGAVDPGDYVGLFNQAWIIIRDNYVRDNFNGVDWDAVRVEYEALFESVSEDEEYWELMTSLVEELKDDHSRYVPPDRMQSEFGTSGGGSTSSATPWTGMRIWPAREDEQLMIWHVCEQGPAAAAGLVRGDVILAIDGEEVVKSDEDWESSDYRAAIYGNEGESEVTLTVLQGPDSEPTDVVLNLGGAAGCETWTHYLLSENPRIGYVRVPNYGGNAASEILSAIEALEEGGDLDGIVVDQRHNPGGNSDDAAGIFAEGTVGSVGPLREDSTRTIYRIRGPVEWNDTTPMVVLIDGNSHSAADYFPAAMKELGRATIIGMNSAGNTEGITAFNLSDGTLIRLAVSTLALNDGTILEGVGVTPDIVVPLGDWGLRQLPYDVQLQAALDFLLDN